MQQTLTIPVSKAPSIELGGGFLQLPNNSKGLIIFAHGSGSGSSATSSRNQIVAKMLNENGLGTLLFDLLTKEEQESDTITQNIKW